MTTWPEHAKAFLRSVSVEGLEVSRSVVGGPATLYGTCYSLLAKYYLGEPMQVSPKTAAFVESSQNADTGLFVGPELVDFRANPGTLHDADHLLMHLTCAVLPFVQQSSISLKHQIHLAHRFCDLEKLKEWTNARDWRRAWFEGNNILFVGQLLIYLRDVEGRSDAQAALDLWFDWLDREMDPATSLWGTNGYCDATEAVYGGYHQLLVYWHEDRQIANSRGLVDTVLSLQHSDGGFNPKGNGGACEDVDSVDILVNCYKRFDYRRAEIRVALRRCLAHILSTQNPDGGFPYNRNSAQSHMGVPGTDAAPNLSCTFPTWFRIHTLALCHEIIPDHPELSGIPFRFNSHLSMGWHKSPPNWKLEVSAAQNMHETMIHMRHLLRSTQQVLFSAYSELSDLGKRAVRKVQRGVKNVIEHFVV